MRMNALRTTEDAVNLPLASTYLAALFAPVILDIPVMVLSAQVRHHYCHLLAFRRLT